MRFKYLIDDSEEKIIEAFNINYAMKIIKHRHGRYPTKIWEI